MICGAASAFLRAAMILKRRSTPSRLAGVLVFNPASKVGEHLGCMAPGYAPSHKAENAYGDDRRGTDLPAEQNEDCNADDYLDYSAISVHGPLHPWSATKETPVKFRVLKAVNSRELFNLVSDELDVNRAEQQRRCRPELPLKDRVHVRDSSRLRG
jgi:hypothetical protein